MATALLSGGSLPDGPLLRLPPGPGGGNPGLALEVFRFIPSLDPMVT